MSSQSNNHCRAEESNNYCCNDCQYEARGQFALLLTDAPRIFVETLKFIPMIMVPTIEASTSIIGSIWFGISFTLFVLWISEVTLFASPCAIFPACSARQVRTHLSKRGRRTCSYSLIVHSCCYIACYRLHHGLHHGRIRFIDCVWNQSRLPWCLQLFEKSDEMWITICTWRLLSISCALSFESICTVWKGRFVFKLLATVFPMPWSSLTIAIFKFLVLSDTPA